ncbi:TPA: prepilin-type N-terminal cleavage/methylation domain-containing protein [Escherichia coli]|nr:prepilin-type N-terminal cleavage/methylation domain-containing protein [Escherichia coli]HBN0662758.1 prepilin-type N-terminal cleavage/methylation domain-containing protein [Escherichia coli]HBN0695220.1 prepilin-type N-terminal cleavage/methylation domain-containing protein [Escherichia coli]HBN0776786.1 prepilin-type N-terminal cleavage/methylation domain-containing protein [Escherichia coli]HBN0828474.1 prepilin-type N-terminal cleavage/methylation domain-containing protein [Escherichia
MQLFLPIILNTNDASEVIMKRKNQHGFSLIEVSLSLILICFGMLFSFYFIDITKMISNSQKISEDFSLIKNYCIKKSESMSPSNTSVIEYKSKDISKDIYLPHGYLIFMKKRDDNSYMCLSLLENNKKSFNLDQLYIISFLTGVEGAYYEKGEIKKPSILFSPVKVSSLNIPENQFSSSRMPALYFIGDERS